MKKSNSKRSTTTNDKSGAGMDDALTLETGSGSNVVTHGLMVDTFARSVPTHILPFYVRDTLMRAWHGMAGRRVDYAQPVLPWYAYDGLDGTTDSVAHRLAVTVQDAEQWGLGNQWNAFSRYADMPLNPATMARWSFWRYDPLAAELDPTMALEPQAYALDAFSQLFSESAMFHFGFLADVDREYHRLRGIGPLGRLDADSSEYEAWYHVYHYWRNQLDITYLAGNDPLVVLPSHLYDGNWTIADVLNELYNMMTTTGGELLPDIIITAKGFQRAADSITLGVQEDAAYHDADGNVRFYFPYMESLTDVDSVHTPIEASMTRQPVPFSDTGTDATGFTGAGSSSVTTSLSANVISVAPIWEVHAQDTHALDSAYSWYHYLYTLYGSGSATNGTSLPLIGDRPNGLWPSVLGGASYPMATGAVLSDFMTIRSLPTTGLLDGHFYWSGHTLNFVELIKFAQEIGRAVEPEVLNTLVYPMGVIGDASSFVRNPSGATARHVDELFNLYESGFSFNENPARLYTAAHLGPTNHVLAQGDLNLAGVPLESRIGDRYVTVRERYWTPSAVDHADAALIAASFFPNTRLDVTLYRNLDIQGLAAFDDVKLRSFVSRALGNVTSMRTKVEKPIYLPAGKSGPETVYASGVGAGATQLVLEMVLALAGGAPRYGLGHGGWTDIRATGTFGESGAAFINRAQANDDEAHSLLYAPSGADVDSVWWDQLGLVGLVGSNRTQSTIEWGTQHPWLPNLGSQVPYGLVTMSTTNSGITVLTNHTGGYSSPSLWYASALITDGNTGHTMDPAYAGDASAGTYSDMMNKLGAIQAPRGLYGEEHTPFHTVITSTMGGSRYYSYGARYRKANSSKVTVTTVVPDALVSAGPNVATDEVSEYTIFTVPEEFDFDFVDSDGITHTFTVVAATNLVDLFSNDGNAGVAIGDKATLMANSLWDGWINFNDGLVAEWQSGSSALYRGITSNGSWASGYVADIAGTSHSLVSAADNNVANIKKLVPNKTLCEVAQAAFSLGCALYGDDPNWSSDLADVNRVYLNLNEYYGLSKAYSGQVNKLVGAFGAATSGPVGGDGGSQLQPFAQTRVGITPRLATLDELNDSIQGIEVTSEFNSAGMTPISAQLTPLYREGVTWEFFSATAYNNEGLKLPYTSGSPMQTIATTVYGVADRSQWNMMGGVWGQTSVELSGTTDAFNYDSGGPAWGSPYTTSPMNTPSQINDWVDGSPMARTVLPEAAGVGANYLRYTGGYFNDRVYNLYNQGEMWGHNKLSSHSVVSIEPETLSYLDGGQIYGLPGIAAFYRSVGLDNLGAQLTFVYPDDPKYKMVYRPWRRIADASILKELRLIFANDGEDTGLSAGALGIKTIGTVGQFRFAELLDAGQPETFILEQATSKTRLTSPSYRSVLTFTKQSLLDPEEQRHTIPDAIDELNQSVMTMGVGHKSGVAGEVLTRAVIRELQLGRQYQNL